MSDLTVARVLDGLRAGRSDLIGILQRLVRCHPIYGSPGQEQALRIAAAHLDRTGMDVRQHSTDLGNLRASPLYVDVAAFGGEFTNYGRAPRSSAVATYTFPADGPDVVLNAHLDVEFVTSPQTWSEPGLWSAGVVRDGKIYGRGASDMLGGVACYLYTLRILSRYFYRGGGSVRVQLVLDEELGGNGTLAELLHLQGPPPDVAVIAEPTDGVVCTATRCFHQFAVVCPGRPVHMSFANAYDNANRVLVDVIQLLEELDRWVADQVSRGAGGRYVMYGIVRGGSDAAVPAEGVEIGVTLALPPQLSAIKVQDRFERQLALLGARLPRRPTVTPFGLSFEGSGPIDHDLPNVIVRAASAHGSAVRTGEFPSACDARLFAAFGIPVVVFGPGSLARAHGSDEFVRVDELDEYCRTLALTLLRLWEIE